jgi:hypothetical protein
VILRDPAGENVNVSLQLVPQPRVGEELAPTRPVRERPACRGRAAARDRRDDPSEDARADEDCLVLADPEGNLSSASSRTSEPAEPIARARKGYTHALSAGVDRLGVRPPRWREPFPVEGRVGTGRLRRSRSFVCRLPSLYTSYSARRMRRAPRRARISPYGGEIGMTAGLTARRGIALGSEPTRRPTGGLSVDSRRVPRVSRLCRQGGPDR